MLSKKLFKLTIAGGASILGNYHRNFPAPIAAEYRAAYSNWSYSNGLG